MLLRCSFSGWGFRRLLFLSLFAPQKSKKCQTVEKKAPAAGNGILGDIPWGASSPPDPLDLALWRQGPRPRRSHCGKGPWQRTQKREKQREKGQSKERRHKGIHKHGGGAKRRHICVVFSLCVLIGFMGQLRLSGTFEDDIR